MSVMADPIKTPTWMTDEEENEYRFTDITKEFFKAGKDWQNLPQEILERAIESKRSSGYIIYNLFLPFKHLMKRMDAFEKADELLDITGLLDFFFTHTANRPIERIDYRLLDNVKQLENKPINARARSLFPEIAICQKCAIGILDASNFVSKAKAFSVRISCRIDREDARYIGVHLTNFVGLYRENDTAFVNLTRLITFENYERDIEEFVDDAIRLYNKKPTKTDFEPIVKQIKQIIAEYQEK
jgi:hypothetical protein